MQNDKNQYDNEKERLDKQANMEASEKMSRNDDLQNEVYRTRQNEITRSNDAEEMQSLSTHKNDWCNDCIPIDEQNKRRLESEKDADFGNEQLQ